MGRKLRMADEKKRVVAIGEVMIEMARGGDGRYGAACGGDTFNTAVYLARAGIEVAYATALGDDPYSDGIVSMATAEGIKTDLILRVPGRLPGLYMIETDKKGERRFRYWRGEAPARELFELPDWNRIAEAMGIPLWCQDEAGPYQAIPQPGATWAPVGKPALRPHEYIRGGTAKLLTLFRPATGEVRAKGVTNAPNAVLHPWLQAELTEVLATLPPITCPDEERPPLARWATWLGISQVAARRLMSIPRKISRRIR